MNIGVKCWFISWLQSDGGVRYTRIGSRVAAFLQAICEADGGVEELVGRNVTLWLRYISVNVGCRVAAAVSPCSGRDTGDNFFRSSCGVVVLPCV